MRDLPRHCTYQKYRHHCVQDNHWPQENPARVTGEANVGEIQRNGCVIDQHAEHGWAGPAGDRQGDESDAGHADDDTGQFDAKQQMPDQRGDKQQPHAIVLAATSVLSGGTRQRKTFLWTKKNGPLFRDPFFNAWSGKRDSNSRPRPWQGRALPTELFPRLGEAHSIESTSPVNPLIQKKFISFPRPSSDAARQPASIGPWTTTSGQRTPATRHNPSGPRS